MGDCWRSRMRLRCRACATGLSKVIAITGATGKAGDLLKFVECIVTHGKPTKTKSRKSGEYTAFTRKA